MNSKPQNPVHVDAKHPADPETPQTEAGREAQEANEAMRKAENDEGPESDAPIPGLRQADIRGSAD
jgi:hypothetical protein